MLRIRNNRLAKLRGIRSREDTVQWGDRETDGGSKLESERVKMSPVLVVDGNKKLICLKSGLIILCIVYQEKSISK